MTTVTSKFCIKNENPTVPENLTTQRALKLNLPKRACKLNPKRTWKLHPPNVPTNLSHQMCLHANLLTHKRSCKLIPPNVPANLSTHKHSCKLIPPNVPANLSHQTCLQTLSPQTSLQRLVDMNGLCVH